MNPAPHRDRELERLRIADLLELAKCEKESALDVGVRDGYVSHLLADHFRLVTALDLTMPKIDDPRIACVAGDVTKLAFPDGSFEMVVCAEVLEHIAPPLLQTACNELARVTRGHLLIGVPYKQDTRVGRTTCPACGTRNPPWGHVNRFDERRLRRLFAGMAVERTSFVGVGNDVTNFVSSSLMDLAGNPYGTYGQDEPCVACGGNLVDPPRQNTYQKLLSKAAFWIARSMRPFKVKHPIWIHLLLRKR